MNDAWLAVASAEHVERGRDGGFMQVCHGKAGPLRRIGAGDGVVYYSPSSSFGGMDALRAFTAIGTARAGDPYQVEMSEGFRPFRRGVDWAEARQAPIRPLLDRLTLTAGKPGWGYQLRFGLLRLDPGDFRLIAEAMGARTVFRQPAGLRPSEAMERAIDTKPPSFRAATAM